MGRQIRVLMLVANLRVSNGVVSYAMNYFRNLDHDRIKMDFCLLDDVATPYYEEVEQQGSRYYVLPNIKNIGQHISKCKNILADGNYDILHDNTMLVSYPMMRIAKKYVPVRILHSHNSKLGETENKEKRNALLLPLLLKQADAYASCSDLAAQAMFGKVDYEFIPNFVESSNYSFVEEKRKHIRVEMGIDNKIIVATVGRIAPQKNPYFALNIIDSLAEKIPNLEYWWIGSGPLDKEIYKYLRKLKHPDQVRLLGSRNDMLDLYHAIDIFFLPSLFEGLPVTGVEAQAMGLPSVVSDTITKEMVYTDLVEFVPLDAPIETWVEAFEKQMKRIPDRRSYTKELEDSVFSSAHAGEKLESYYRRLLSEINR